MTPEESFDRFYSATRRRVLHQALALTGDLATGTSAARGAYEDAWRRWHAVSALADPERWLRTRLWDRTLRAHLGRGHDPGTDPARRAVLAGLAGLPTPQRRVLVLVRVAGVPLPRAASELGLAPETAAARLEAGEAALAARLEVPATDLTPLLGEIDPALDGVTLPRPTVLRRKGRSRHRVRAAAALLGSVAVGALVAAVAGYVLAGPRPPAATPPADEPAVPSADAGSPTAAGSGSASAQQTGLPSAGDLLDADQIRRLGTARPWRVTSTGTNTGGDGLNTVCQRARFADPDGLAAVVRTYRAGGPVTRGAVQTVEVSRSPGQAERAFRTTLSWYAGCQEPRLQLLESYRVGQVGSEARVLVLRVWRRPVTTYSVALARVGEVTTTTVGRTVGAAPPPRAEIAQSLADAVSMLCASTRASRCATSPELTATPPPPSGEAAGLLAVADLPPVGTVARPWVGTGPGPGRPNPSRTTCDGAGFAGAVRARARTFLVPGAPLPARFGLSESVGTFRTPRAAQDYLNGVRARVAGCEDREVVTSVTADAEGFFGPRRPWSSWDLATEVSEDETVRFRVGLVRLGRHVAHLTFTPAPAQDVTAARFRALLERATARLGELPDP